jgi:hypothetical protein
MEEYLKIVQQQIQTKSLWRHNTVVNPHGPHSGDLVIVFTTTWTGSADRHHTALAIRDWVVGVAHPKQGDQSIPDFPGPDVAESQPDQTEYFMGTLDGSLKFTASRAPDQDRHFDYLNSRGEAKRNAEIIYFANVRQIAEMGFEYRMYSPSVLTNWDGWDGKSWPSSR